MTLSNVFEIIVLISFFIIIYTFILYPIFVYILAKLIKRPIITKTDELKKIAVVIAAYNEEDTIEEAIQSILKSGYPLDKVTIYVGLDGSTDSTYNILQELQKKNNNIVIYKFERGGKNRTLNKLMEKIKEDFVFFLDADLRVQPNTFQHLVSILQAENVAGVMIPVKIVNEGTSDSGGTGEKIYQKFDAFIRNNESLIYSTANSLGTLFGIRREALSPIPNDRVCDDLYRVFHIISLRKRFIFDTKFSVTEVRTKSLNKELNRRIRLVSGGISTLMTVKKILSPSYGLMSIFVISHKLLRWLTPVFMIIFLLSLFFIETDSFLYYPLLYFNLIVYGFAFLGWIFEKLNINFLPFKVMLFFVSMNIGFLLGIFRFLRKKQNSLWDRNKLDDEIKNLNLN
ncbi:MAG: glycosyltransferase [Candidatus Kapabacteria bacterium]|nr:glycosyltransferase [Candidatus Kapabacteria bacterium]